MSPGPLTSRRQALALGATALAASGVRSVARAAGDVDSDALQQLPSLKANRAGLPMFGLVASAARLANERPYFAQMAMEMGLYTLESDFQWSAIQRKPEEWDFRHTDEGVAFAKSHGVAIVGHALYYHYFIPEWLRASSDVEALDEGLKTRIDKTVTRYRGSISRWDVVNEPLKARDGLPNGLRASAYSRAMGDRYIETAFRQAKAADPDALLCLNEAEIEYADQQPKRDDLLALLRRLRERSAPVEALGLQSHLTAGQSLDPRALHDFLKQVSDLGIKLAVTELDVIDDALPTDPKTRDRLVADHVGAYLRVVRDSGDLVSVTCWGYSDRNTWLDMWHKRADGRPLRPLPFDFDLMRKPMWGAIREVIAA